MAAQARIPSTAGRKLRVPPTPGVSVTRPVFRADVRSTNTCWSPQVRRHGLNRAVALRIAACGIMGLGAALLIAALLLSTYTHGKIAKIPLDLDATLVSDGTGTALDPASLAADRFAINKNVPLTQQQQMSVEA